jgi:hypothetical protein
VFAEYFLRPGDVKSLPKYTGLIEKKCVTLPTLPLLPLPATNQGNRKVTVFLLKDIIDVAIRVYSGIDELKAVLKQFHSSETPKKFFHKVRAHERLEFFESQTKKRAGNM